MAKGGCRPRPINTTERPSRRAIIASNEPAKPEPITARSKAALIIQPVTITPRTTRPRLNLLRCIHPLQPRAAAPKADVAIRKCFQIPQVRKDAPALKPDAVGRGFF